MEYDETAEVSEDGMVYFLIPVMKVGSEITVSITVKDSTDKIVQSGSKKQTVRDGCSIAVTLTGGEVIMKTGSGIKTALQALGANSGSNKTFAASPTPPADGVATEKLSADDSPTEVLAWCDGTSIKYYAAGYTDASPAVKIPLNADSKEMFYSCSKLSSIDMSGFDTSNVTNMFSMFFNCSALTSLTGLSGFDTSNVTIMNCMFQMCSSLTSLDVSGWNTGNVTNMGVMFESCSSLGTIYASAGPAGFTTANVTYSSYMFDGCTSLVGGAGTTYSAGHTGKDYARIDGGPTSATPGYFTSH